MSSDNKQISAVMDQMSVEQYWSAKNRENRWMELAIGDLTFENSALKEFIERQKAEILALKKANRRLQGLPEDEPVVIDIKELIGSQDNGIIRSYCGEKLFDEDEELEEGEDIPGEKFDYEEDEEDWQLGAFPVRQYCYEELPNIDEEVKVVPKSQSLFETDLSFIMPLISEKTFIRVGDDTPLRNKTPNYRRHSFNC
uniref:Uncharacterized protein n=1 Tax=viral metagenome TaxID=1070528 RepID=A0A6C0ASY7_9ZZZZ